VIILEQSDDQQGGNDDGGNQGDNNPPEPEAYRKFHLYQKYVSLYNYINKYADRLQVASYDDIYVTSIVKLVMGKLNSLKKAVYQYLMLKFDKVSYVEAYIYYETCYNILKLSMDLLQNTMDKVKQ